MEVALSDRRFLKVRTYNGRLQADFREYYEKDGQLLPGKKGIALNQVRRSRIQGEARRARGKSRKGFR